MPTYVEPDLNFVKGVIAAGGDTLKRCYQCATCAVVCPLSTDERPFPRKQMILAQWGMADRIAKDPAIWLCHQCSDCTAYCPRGARPGDVLAAIRAMAIREYAEPKILWSLYNNLGGLLVLFGLAVSVIVAMILIFNKGVPELETPVRFSHGLFHGFLPVLAVDAIFLPLAGFAALVSLRGIAKMWNQLMQGVEIPEAYKATTGEMISNYIIPTVKEILAHERFKKCGVNFNRFTGHRFVLWAFIILFVVTNIVFVGADFLGFHTPWPLWNPVKLFANFGAVILIYGSILLIQNRKAREAEGNMSGAYADWFLLYLILFVGITGLGAEILRLLNLKLAYPTYIAHLACVFVLFLGLPYSKFAHLLYRTTVMVYERYVDDVRQKMAASAPVTQVQEEVSEESEAEEAEEAAEGEAEEQKEEQSA